MNIHLKSPNQTKDYSFAIIIIFNSVYLEQSRV